jgi:hypothetical protein
LGAPYYADTPFLNGIYVYGGANSFDIAGFHEYSNALSGSGVQNDVNMVQSVLQAHGQEKKPIWIGEYGYREPSSTANDVGHIAVLRIMLGSVTGYAEAIWYNLRDDEAMSCCPPRVVKIGYWGLVQRNDATLKKSYLEMRTLIARLSPPPTLTATP